LENGKIKLIHKAGDVNDPGNWRPITLASIIYGIIFGRISQVMMSKENRLVRKSFLSFWQSCFIPRINECRKYIDATNMAIIRE
jgi:hypothetical protein